MSKCNEFFDFNSSEKIYLFEDLTLKGTTFYFTWFYGEKYEKAINLFIFSENQAKIGLM